ncbi:MAG TPA: MotA/TolQ/ExbB proton channel family protein [Geothrix sp.]|nr:MotA/TolQ/ExbB proton channel family protein [Geothrix sp.]
MLEIVIAGGWVMLPLVLCSIAATGIVVERSLALRVEKVAPRTLLPQIWQWHKAGQLDGARLRAIHATSPLGKVLAAGLKNSGHTREVMKEAIEDAGRQVLAELERFLNMLGTIGSLSPLLGLLGTVLGMIQMFSGVAGAGALGSPAAVAGGIAQALITTAAGLIIAIPSVMAYRYLKGRVDAMVLVMEADALRLVEMIHGEREAEEAAA